MDIRGSRPPGERSAGRAVPAWRAQLLRGLRSLALGDFDRAEAAFAAAHRRAPAQPEVCFALGREHLRRNRLEEAEPLLRQAWEGDRTLAVAAGALARCVGVGGRRFAEAHALLDEAQGLHPGSASLLVVRAEVFLEEEKPAEARATLEAAAGTLDREGREAGTTRAAVTAGMARVLNLEGIELARARRADEALFAFKRAADLDPAWTAPLVNMGVAFSQLRRHARARSCYERALAREPRNLVARFNLSSLARDRGDLERAEAGFRAVLESDPAYPGGPLALAEVLVETGRAREAIRLLEDQLAHRPDDASARFHLALAYEAAGDPAAAVQQLRTVLALDDGHPAATRHLARLLGATGRAAEAATLAGDDPDDAC